MGLHGAPRAHAYEERSGEVRPGLCERERERVHNYLELPNNSRSFFYLFWGSITNRVGNLKFKPSCYKIDHILKVFCICESPSPPFSKLLLIGLKPV